MKRRVAANRCRACGNEWNDLPAGFARHDRCPACGSVYWIWTDYAEERPLLGTRAVNLATPAASGKRP